MNKLCTFGIWALTFIIVGSMLVPGYILTLDMVFGPVFNYEFETAIINASLPIFTGIGYLGEFIPLWLVQKIIIILIFSLSGYSMNKLLHEIPMPVRFVGVVLYMVNPFIYMRFLAGQWLFLMGYALFPLWIHSLFSWFHYEDKKRALHLFLVTNVLIITSYHHIFLMLLFLLVSLAFYWKKFVDLNVWKQTGMMLVGTVLIQLYWIIPLLSGSVRNIEHYSNQFQLFALAGTNGIDILLRPLFGYGFWVEVYGFASQFVVTFDSIMLAFGYVILFVGIAGITGNVVKSIHNRILLLAGIGGLLLALLSSIDVFQHVFASIPGMVVMRDAHKWVQLWMVVLPVGVVYALHNWMPKIKREAGKNLLLFGMLLSITLFMWPMFWGFGGQLKSVDYPESWYEVKEIVEQDTSEPMLVLPWHTYLSVAFNDHVLIHQPAFRFFQNPVIYNRNAQFNGIEIANNNEEAIETVLEDLKITIDEHTSFSYVLVHKEADYLIYSIEWPIVFESDDVILYKR